MEEEEDLKHHNIEIARLERQKYGQNIPFLRDLLLGREQCTKPEQELYDFIIANWLWCIPVWNYSNNEWNNKLVGYRILNKELIMKHAFDFG